MYHWYSPHPKAIMLVSILKDAKTSGQSILETFGDTGIRYLELANLKSSDEPSTACGIVNSRKLAITPLPFSEQPHLVRRSTLGPVLLVKVGGRLILSN